MNEGGACVYIFLEQYGFGPFSHGEIFFHAISYAELSELGGGCRVEGVLTPLALFLLWTLSEPWGQIMPTKLIHAFRIFTPSYGSASCFRSKFFLPSCPRLGDIEKDKYIYMKVWIFKLAVDKICWNYMLFFYNFQSWFNWASFWLKNEPFLYLIYYLIN